MGRIMRARMKGAVEKTPERTAADEAFPRAAGAWRGKVDSEALIRMLYEARLRPSRSAGRCGSAAHLSEMEDTRGEGLVMETTVEDLVREARRLSLPQQLTLIEKLAQSIQTDLEQARSLRTELAAWDGLSDEALADLEKAL